MPAFLIFLMIVFHRGSRAHSKTPVPKGFYNFVHQTAHDFIKPMYDWYDREAFFKSVRTAFYSQKMTDEEREQKRMKLKKLREQKQLGK